MKEELGELVDTFDIEIVLSEGMTSLKTVYSVALTVELGDYDALKAIDELT